VIALLYFVFPILACNGLIIAFYHQLTCMSVNISLLIGATKKKTDNLSGNVFSTLGYGSSHL